MPYVVDFTENLSGASASNGWALQADHDHATYPNMKNWVDRVGPPGLAGHVLFWNWHDGGPLIRTLWHEKVFTGFIPGQAVGFHMHVDWGLHTDMNNVGASVFLGLEGGDGTNAVEIAPRDPTFDLWTIPSSPFGNVRDNVLAGFADANGEVKAKWGAKRYGGSANLSVSFAGVLEIVHFVPTSVYGYIQKFHGARTTFIDQPISTVADELISDENDDLIYARTLP